MKNTLKKVVATNKIEAMWLNTLSLLEHTGALKIFKTVYTNNPTIDILQHMADETRHAYAFKRLSLEVSNGRCKEYLCKDEALHYFHQLDHETSEWLSDRTGENNVHHNYLLTTTLIERRAMKLYPLYKQATRHDNVESEMQKIILEESRHKPAVELSLQNTLKEKDIPGLEHCEALEIQLFDKFFEEVGKKAEELK